MIRYIAIVALGLSLSACAGEIATGRLIADKASYGAAQAVCLTTLGAYFRMDAPKHKAVGDFAKVFCR